MKPTLGIDQIKISKKCVGILCHPSSVASNFSHIINILERQTTVTALFGPQHGFYGETQDNMMEWQDHKDSRGRSIYSLYGERRHPTDQSLKNVELMVIDLVDVGTRYYTFIYTMAYMLEACGRLNIPVLVCDRPNPLGGQLIEGPILDLKYKSFVGLFPLPICHGMTIGELAVFFADQMNPRPTIQILKMKNWKRSMMWRDTGLRWTLPSPHMPSFETALFYPGMCLLEGMTLSEGRGTTRPFELIGAPFLKWDEIEKEYQIHCKKLKLEPVHFHRQGYIPTFHKFKGELCQGALQICKKPYRFFPVRHGVLLLWIFKKLCGDQWKWKKPPYEYEYEKLPIDILTGGKKVRETIDSQRPLKPLFEKWKEDEELFKKQRKSYLLY